MFNPHAHVRTRTFLQVLEDGFFSSGERQELVHRIITSNRRHRGAEVLLPALLGTLPAAKLAHVSERQLAWVLAHVGVDADGEGIKGQADLLARLTQEIKTPPVKALVPLHQVPAIVHQPCECACASAF